MKQTSIVKNAVEKLEKFNESKHLLVGFDGFVDEIIHMVDKRKNDKDYDRIADIKSFAERIAQVAGLSANIEKVPIQTKLGGNGPIMGNAVIAQDHEVTYIGALGKHFIHPVFREFADSCKNVYSLTEPGYTDALEFYDGKIMMGKMNNLVEVNIENLLEKLSRPELVKLLEQVDMIAFTNWTMLSNLNGIITEFNKIISKQKKKPFIFIDLADPKKRTHADIREVLQIISGMKAETILSMNLSESTIISLNLGIKEDEILTRAILIREKLGIAGVVIHPTNGAAIATEKQSKWVDGPFTAKPKLTTGAGDNFNAGFCTGWLAGMEPAESLALGVCSSGFYVRNARSASRDDLSDFMKKWAEVNCGTI
ncbi:MAG: carbohydrate kinase family protein [Bacteroidetes bacterium]|nr:MAG: carbohydrate kinase family protein [Bacteroidota bacterium]